MSIKTFGLKAFRDAIDYNIKLAEQVEAVLRKSDKWEIVSPANLAIINFRYNPVKENLSEDKIDLVNQKIAAKMMASGEAQLVTTILLGQVVLRMCLINPKTTLEDVMSTIVLCEKFALEHE
jgi:glutamate/tyrosine decarboxylase-like PLP-dependent enzyme